ncbi:CDP-archaeol synthase [Kosakonia sp. H02]|nr:CDP-archaeol synthase [Kosakonia sp. H02]
MGSSLFALWLLLLPVFIAGCFHMLVVSRGWLPWLAVPLSTRLFGGNKTWRGFAVVPLVSALVAPLCLGGEIKNALLLGVVTGLGYMLGELPNSMLKRWLKISPGQLPPRHRGVFIFLDQADSALGVALGCMWLLALDLVQTLTLMALFIVSVPVIKNVLYVCSLKESRF